MADIAVVIRVGIGLYLLVAAVSKLIDRDSFVAALTSYTFVPQALVKSLSIAVPAAESVIASGLVVGFVAPVEFGLAGAALMVALAALLASEVATGSVVDCGCVTFAPHRVGWGTVSFDLALAAALVFEVWAQGVRAGSSLNDPTPAMLIGIAIAMTFLLISQLISNRQAFESFRRRRGYRPNRTPIGAGV